MVRAGSGRAVGRRSRVPTPAHLLGPHTQKHRRKLWGRRRGKISGLRACSTTECRPRSKMATAHVVLHVFTTLNQLSSPKTKHASEPSGTQAKQAPKDKQWARSAGSEERKRQACVLFPGCAVSAHDSPVSMGRLALPRRAALLCRLREDGCMFRAGSGRAVGRRSRVPTGAAVRLLPIGNEGTDLLGPRASR